VTVKPIRILILADTHIGIDSPAKPRIQKTRRGDDFMRNYKLALRPALEAEVDLVIHGGDLLYRSKVPATLFQLALEPLIEVAERGIPVILVPGNHERSKIKVSLFESHPNLQIFHEPQTFHQKIRGTRIALSGFPYQRELRQNFLEVLSRSAWQDQPADFHLLCMHQAIEGAIVGPQNYTFRNAADVLRLSEVPQEFDVLISGHIHRAQVLRHDLKNRALPFPVIYPGSIERTSFAESKEDKGYVILELDPSGKLQPQIYFNELPTRPMILKDILLTGQSAKSLKSRLNALADSIPKNSQLTIRFTGVPDEDCIEIIRIGYLRSIFPREAVLSVGFKTTNS
jgi:DNA repair protein SbcD/Mre11